MEYRLLSRIWYLVVVLALVGCAAREKSATQAAKSAKQPHSLREFSEEVMKYAKLRQRLASKLPKLPDKATAEQIAAHRKALADLMRKERAGAKQGDIFETDSGLLLVHTIQQHLDGPEGAEMKAAIRDQAPRSVPLRVNDTYPDDAPKSLMPPGLLLQLPQLPKDVEYRFVDRHLILLDVEAGLIVDYTRDVFH